MPRQVAQYDDSRVRHAFDKAPTVFSRELDKWLNKERFAVLGSTKRNIDRGLRGKLYHLPTESGSDGWSKNFVGQFASFKTNPKTLNPSVTMGLLKSNERINKALQFMEHGGVITTGKYMVIPNIKGLQYFGITRQGQAAEYFKQHMKDKDMSVIFKKGEVFYTKPAGSVTDARKAKHGSSIQENILLFTLRRKIRVKKQFNFLNAWDKRRAKAETRGEQAVYRATRTVERLIRDGRVSGGF